MRFVISNNGPPSMTDGSLLVVSGSYSLLRPAMHGCWIPKIALPRASHRMAFLSRSILKIPIQASLWNGKADIELKAPPSSMQTRAPQAAGGEKRPEYRFEERDRS